MSDSLLQESGNISGLGDTFRQTIFNPEPKTNTRNRDLNKQITQPLSSGKKSNSSLNGFEGTRNQSLLSKLLPQEKTFDNRHNDNLTHSV
jgi:hypothetical protein